MKRLLLSVLAVFLASSPAYPQSVQDVGAGVISFLLLNPKTANRMKPDERIALDILADLLRTEGKRKHELEYAASGRNQITINVGDGRRAEFVRNTSGEVFLLLDGIIYPIAAELLREAAGLSTVAGPETAIADFLDAVRAGSLSRMAELWGSARGPSANYIERREREQRLTVIRAYLLHDRYEILPRDRTTELSTPHAYQVRLSRTGCVGVVDFSVVRYGDGWLVSNIDLVAARDQLAGCSRP